MKPLHRTPRFAVDEALHRLLVEALTLPSALAISVVVAFSGNTLQVAIGAVIYVGFNIAANRWLALPDNASDPRVHRLRIMANLALLAGVSTLCGPEAPTPLLAVPVVVAAPYTSRYPWGLVWGLVALLAPALPTFLQHGFAPPAVWSLVALLAYLASTFRLADDARRRVTRWLEVGARTEHAALAKADFLVSMSHELRTPMNTVLGVGRLLEGSTLDPEQRAHLQVMRESGRDLLAIIDDLLDFSRLEAGRMTIDLVPFAVAELIEGLARRFEAEANTRGLILRTQVEPDLRAARFVGDPNRIRQVLVNLVGNALKFTDQGEVVLSVGPNTDATGVIWRVQDTGIGIPPDRLGSLFEPFQQAERSTAGRYGGSGLGLAISRALAHQMEGEISVRSVLGEGSEFRFEQRLFRAPDEELPAPVAQTPTPAAGAGRRVLVVDDELVARTVTARILTKAGFVVEVFDDGGPALARLFDPEPPRPAAIVLDVQMPTVDGLEVVRRLRATEGPLAAIPIVGLTAGSGDAVRRQCREAGFDTVLLKPVAPETLCATVDAFAHRR